jgi:hypothetical protein
MDRSESSCHSHSHFCGTVGEVHRPIQLYRLTVAMGLVLLHACPLPAFAWNPPGHMLSGSISYQLLQRESPYTVGAVRSLLEKHPWYEKHWRAQLNNFPDPDRNEILFMVATNWADDVRTTKDNRVS